MGAPTPHKGWGRMARDDTRKEPSLGPSPEIGGGSSKGPITALDRCPPWVLVSRAGEALHRGVSCLEGGVHGRDKILFFFF